MKIIKYKNLIIKYIWLAIISGLFTGGGCVIETGPLSLDGASPTVIEILPTPAEPVEIPDISAAPSAAPQPEKSFAETQLQAMTIEEKIGQLFFIAFRNEGCEFTDGMARTLTRFRPAGVVLFSEKIGTYEQTAALTAELKRHADVPLFVATDEEGGRVSRVGKLFEDTIAAADQTASAQEARERGAELARRLKGLGFNMDLAPVADVRSNPENTVIGDRAFSENAETAAEYVAAFIQGMQAEGVLTVIKHFPGHGDTSEDSHRGMAVFRHDMAHLTDIDLKPFISGIAAGTDAVMAGHISAPEITGDHRPASLSPVMITEILRGQLGYDGLVMTDAMDMGAVTDLYAPGEAAVMALAAGVDIILMPPDLEAAYAAVMAAYANGTLTEERIDQSVMRVLAVKEKLFYSSTKTGAN